MFMQLIIKILWEVFSNDVWNKRLLGLNCGLLNAQSKKLQVEHFNLSFS